MLRDRCCACLGPEVRCSGTINFLFNHISSKFFRPHETFLIHIGSLIRNRHSDGATFPFALPEKKSHFFKLGFPFPTTIKEHFGCLLCIYLELPLTSAVMILKHERYSSTRLKLWSLNIFHWQINFFFLFRSSVSLFARLCVHILLR